MKISKLKNKKRKKKKTFSAKQRVIKFEENPKLRFLEEYIDKKD